MDDGTPGADHVAPGAAGGTLRDRKKAQTRRTLVIEAVESFTRDGAGDVTLDDLCARVSVSKRTFFRYFSSKEDVAMTPLQDLWQEFLRRLATTPQRGDPQARLLTVLRDTLVASIRECAERDPDWIRLARLALRLDAADPSFAAHNLRFCDQTIRSAANMLRPDPGTSAPEDLRLRLLLDMLLAAFRGAQRAWISGTEDGSDPENLVSLIHHAIAALPVSLELTAAATQATANGSAHTTDGE